MQSEYNRLGGHFPPEVEALIKEFAQPIVKKPIHYKAIKPLFDGQKKKMMERFLRLKCPNPRDIMCRTRLNLTYRNALIEYNKEEIGEVYEWLTSMLYESDFVGDILTCAKSPKQEKVENSLMFREIMVLYITGNIGILCYPYMLMIWDMLHIPMRPDLNSCEIACCVLTIAPFVTLVMCLLIYTFHIMSKLFI